MFRLLGSRLLSPAVIKLFPFDTQLLWRCNSLISSLSFIYILLLLLFHWHYSPLWALACRKMSFHFFLFSTNSLHLLIPSTWRSLSTSSFHPFLGLPLLLVPSSSWAKIFLGIVSSSILSRWPNQLIFALLSILLYFLLCSSLLVLDSSNFSIPRFHI